MSLLEKINRRCFNFVHLNNLVYNTCWEDPRLDREALQLTADDSVVVITSAGCNALDYVLAGAGRVDAVDMNPRQNALLELKATAIRQLDFDTFFNMFGRGTLPDGESIYREALRPQMSPFAQRYWDRFINFFAGSGWRRSFYFRGSAGTLARAVNTYVDKVVRIRPVLEAAFAAPDLATQAEIYHRELKPKFWKPFLRWLLRRNLTLSMLGVPAAQREQLELSFPGGIGQFVEDSIAAVFAELPLHDNYFWRVYLTGEYTPDCCPEYLKRENFDRLKAGLIDRLHWHTNSVLKFLEQHDQPVTRFVLLDHMDWLHGALHEALVGEWQAIVERAAPNARILWRSGGLKTPFVDRVPVTVGGTQTRVGELLTYHTELAERLHPLDRVHTYGSFFIADLNR
ncbi:MAG: BtaA family protein [Planctomycetaceae bacterium]|nr:BtaA family protein [Planctomycetaceae bacterium]